MTNVQTTKSLFLNGYGQGLGVQVATSVVLSILINAVLIAARNKGYEFTDNQIATTAFITSGVGMILFLLILFLNKRDWMIVLGGLVGWLTLPLVLGSIMLITYFLIG